MTKSLVGVALAVGLVAGFAWSDPADEATITGTVTLKGDPPKRKKVRMDADEKCAAMHDKPVLTEDAVVSKEGRIQGCFVYVKKGLEGKKFDVPKDPVVLTQKGCRYDPHVFGIMAGQALKVRNDDDTLHNIHALPKLNQEFNFGQPQKGMEETKKFDNVEVMVKFKCDVHPWMSAWAGVLPHPYWAVTTQDGKFEIKGLPPGKYTIEVWHEVFGTTSAEVEVKAGDSKTVDFTFEKK